MDTFENPDEACRQPVQITGGTHPNARDHPNSRANLRPPWRKGQSGNPRGRPRGSTPGDFLRHLMTPDATEDSLRAIAQDPKQPVARRAAARMLLNTLDEDPEVARRAMNDAMDRSEGRPAQRHVVAADRSPDPEQALARAREELRQFGVHTEPPAALPEGSEEGSDTCVEDQ